MAFTAEFVFEHEDHFLRRTLESHEDAHVRIAYSTRSTDDDLTVFLYLIDFPDCPAFEQSLTADPSVSTWDCMYANGNYATYRMTANATLSIYETAAEYGVFIEQIWSEAGEANWHVRALLPSRGLLQQVRSLLDDLGVSYSLETLRAVTPEKHTGALTEGQFTLLREAYEYGYFQVPRGVSQADLAARHDITESAVSQQIRRAMQRVLTSYFHDGTESSPGF